MTLELSISRYRGGRHWAVKEVASGSLVCLCVYRKGAVEVVKRLTGKAPVLPKRQRHTNKRGANR